MATLSTLNIKLKISEGGLTPDPTEINESKSITIQANSVSTSRKHFNASQAVRVLKNGYSLANDKFLYLKNIGDTDFSIQEASSGGSIGNTWGALKVGDVSLFRLKKGYDIWLTNLSSGSNGKVEYSYWECKQNAE